MDNKEFMTEVLARHGLTDKPVKFGKVWVYPSEFRKAKRGDVHYAAYAAIPPPCLLERHFGHETLLPQIIYTPCTLPPRHDAETIKQLTPAGMVMTVTEEPDLESRNYINCEMQLDQGARDPDKFHGLRYGVTLTPVKEPVVEYWKATGGWSLKTVDGVQVAATRYGDFYNGTRISHTHNGFTPITADEYIVASKHEASISKGASLCYKCGNIEAVCKCNVEAVKTCGNCGRNDDCPDVALGMVCSAWIPKPEQVKEIENIVVGSHYSQRLHEKINELIEAVNKLKARA